jgi:hypothetical protein
MVHSVCPIIYFFIALVLQLEVSSTCYTLCPVTEFLVILTLARAPLFIHIIGTRAQVRQPNSIFEKYQNLSSTSGEPEFVAQLFVEIQPEISCARTNKGRNMHRKENFQNIA